jgi:hypothetical protein
MINGRSRVHLSFWTALNKKSVDFNSGGRIHNRTNLLPTRVNRGLRFGRSLCCRDVVTVAVVTHVATAARSFGSLLLNCRYGGGAGTGRNG